MAPRGGSWLCSSLVHSNSLCLMGSTGFPQRCRVRITVRFRVGVGVKVRISVRAGVGFRIMVRIRVRMLDSSAGDLPLLSNLGGEVLPKRGGSFPPTTSC